VITKLPISLAGAAAAILWFAPNVTAQSSTDPAAPALATMLQGGVMGELLSVNVPRSQEEIGRLLDEARRLEKMAAGEIATCRRLATEAEGRTTIMKQEIETTKARRDAAKKIKDKAMAAEYDASFKKQSSELKYLARLQSAVNADADRLEAAKSAAGTTAKALELELEVVQKQAELGAAGTPMPEAVQQYRNLLRDMLQAQRDAANKGLVAADKKKKLAEQRLKQLAALSKL
jgi:hypothetical protein